MGAKHEKIPMQRAIYLGPHSVPGRYVLGFWEGSRVIAGATFLPRFPEVCMPSDLFFLIEECSPVYTHLY